MLEKFKKLVSRIFGKKEKVIKLSNPVGMSESREKFLSLLVKERILKYYNINGVFELMRDYNSKYKKGNDFIPSEYVESSSEHELRNKIKLACFIDVKKYDEISNITDNLRFVKGLDFDNESGVMIKCKYSVDGKKWRNLNILSDGSYTKQ